jgi:hypothetical protein
MPKIGGGGSKNFRLVRSVHLPDLSPRCLTHCLILIVVSDSNKSGRCTQQFEYELKTIGRRVSFLDQELSNDLQFLYESQTRDQLYADGHEKEAKRA